MKEPFKPMYQLGCTGEFGCNCPDLQTRDQNLRGHGTRQKYNRGCNCLPCMRAAAKYMREWRARRARRNT